MVCQIILWDPSFFWDAPMLNLLSQYPIFYDSCSHTLKTDEYKILRQKKKLDFNRFSQLRITNNHPGPHRPTHLPSSRTHSARSFWQIETIPQYGPGASGHESSSPKGSSQQQWAACTELRWLRYALSHQMLWMFLLRHGQGVR